MNRSRQVRMTPTVYLLSSNTKSTESASSFVRCSPSEDATNGFFVSCFIRTDGAQVVDSSENFLKKRKRDGESSKRKAKKRAT